VAAREDRAKRRQERRADAAGEARAHERGRPTDGQRGAAADATPAAGKPIGEEPRGHFLQESVAELKKVEWPGQTQVVQATTVVLIACIIVGLWLYANDFIWQRVVKDFLLK
jgi:preprotein translocase SecE subunit